jgi:UTP-glucose-1-phosphate uridylyltransferase/mevalonate kinase
MSEKKIDLFVPGRLCLFGEHSDWAGQLRKFNSDIMPGQALVACTSEGIHATAQVSDKLKLRTVTPGGETLSFECPFVPDELRRIASEGGYFSYIAGVAAYVSLFYDIGGIEIDCYKVTLPTKKGLSSSAAVCVLTARAFNRLYGLNLTVRGEMEAAYHGEQLTPSRCGRLDQACAFGEGIMHMKFDGDVLDVTPAQVGAPLHFVFADLNAQKDTIIILRDLNDAYPYARTDAHKNLHNLLGTKNSQIISQAMKDISSGEIENIGKLMTAAQNEFDMYAAPLSPQELKAEKLHAILSDPNIAQWTFGGKGVGSQGDGMVQFTAKDAESQEALKNYLNNSLGLDSYTITIPKTKAVRKAVIPVAGYGTRMYPATKMIKKEFFPVIDKDGYAKPALLIILDELVSAGIDKICLIIQPGEEDLYLSLFKNLQQTRNLPGNLKAYEQKLSALQGKIEFAYQEQMLGFGHAVLQSASFAENEPVLLMLGDHLYHSNSNLNCAEQLINAYEKTEKLTIGIFEVKPEEAPKYGIVKGELAESNLAKLSRLSEKPSTEYATKNLGINGKQYAVFMYVLTPQVYTELNRQFAEVKTEFGEFQLTPALEATAQNTGAYGAIIDGHRYDIGLPHKYRETVATFGM